MFYLYLYACVHKYLELKTEITFMAFVTLNVQ